MRTSDICNQESIDATSLFYKSNVVYIQHPNPSKVWVMEWNIHATHELQHKFPSKTKVYHNFNLTHKNKQNH